MLFSVWIISGCTTVQEHPAYNMWQERAYSAYGMPAPNGGSYKATRVQQPDYQMLTPLNHLSSNKAIRISQPLSGQEKNFIAKYYALQ